MATATATAGSSNNDGNGAVPDVKGKGAEVISVDSNDEDCGMDAGSSSTAIIVDGGSDGMEPMEPMEPIGVD